MKTAAATLPDVEPLVAGKFRIERMLGEGGMGVVYQAVHCELDQPVAIKVIRRELACREDLVDRMLHEARTTARLRSEHVARVLDAGRLPNGAPFLVMEYLEGVDLSTRLTENGPLPVSMACSYLLQCCEAVAEAHAEGIIHRDLKPDNLFLTSGADGTAVIKVLDFGISKAIGESERTPSRRFARTDPRAIVGSPEYMSPEQLTAGAAVDARTDVWSLGVVLQELVTGRTPFEADTLTRVLTRVLYEAPAPPSSWNPAVPPEVDAIVARCLEKDPARRFASIADLACALAPLGDGRAAELAERVVRIASGLRQTFRASVHSRITPTPHVVSRPRLSQLGVSSTPTPVHMTPAHPAPGEPLASKRRWPLVLVTAVGIAAAVIVGNMTRSSRDDGSALVADAEAAADSEDEVFDRSDAPAPAHATTTTTTTAIAERVTTPPLASAASKEAADALSAATDIVATEVVDDGAKLAPIVPAIAPAKRQRAAAPAAPKPEAPTATTAPVDAGAILATAATVSEPASPPAAEATEPPAPAPAPSSNAWDSDALGGRR